jgi:subtilisin family serine protease
VFVQGRENPDNDPDGRAEVWDDPNINYATWTGTSFSAPLVAAQIAVLKSAMSPATTMHEAKDLLLGMSRRAVDPGCGQRVIVELPGQT